MQVEGWKYYNHAMIPTTAPNETPDTRPIESGVIWKAVGGGTPLLARWTTDWDCDNETNWWYVIKDKPFDIESLKSNYRYKINKGCKYFDVRVIDPRDYKEEIYAVQVAAFSAYPAKYRPRVDKNIFMNSIDTWDDYKAFGAFHRENKELVGYVLIKKNTQYFYELSVQKTKPQYEKFQLNAALVKGVMDQYKEMLSNGGIICDGEKPINHETHFQDYLEKYFGFRKAYCKLNVKYRAGIGAAVKVLYPFRGILKSFDDNSMVHKINGVLKMEEIVREG